jgi:VWFA-related protein
MIRFCLSSFTLFSLLCLCGVAQSVGGNSAGPGPEQPQAMPVSKAGSGPVNLQVRTNLVLVDVVVTAKGKPVDGLARDRFHVTDGGAPEEITTFEEHMLKDAPVTLKAPDLGPNVYTDFPQYSVGSAANVLLLDALNTPLADQEVVRQEMIAYLKNIPPGTKVAVFTLASRLRMVQGFTTDSSVISRAVSGKDTLGASVALDHDADGNLNEEENDLSGQADQGPSSMDVIMSNLQQFQADMQSFQDDVREQITLNALQQLAQYLTAIPGRKNLIWFSGSFPLRVEPDANVRPMKGSLSSPFAAMRDYTQDVHRTDDLLSAARVAVYPIDARGLMGDTTMSAESDPHDQSLQSTLRSSAARPNQLAKTTAAQARVVDDQLKQTEIEQETMQQIAADTGGKAFVNTNGLKEAVGEAVNNGANYYTIGYTPQLKEDGSYRQIKLDVEGDYDVAYRRGYYADASPSQDGDTAAAKKPAWQAAIQRGAPPSNGILFKVRVISATDPAAKGMTPASGAAGTNAKKLKGPVTRYMIDYIVDPSRFTFQKTPDGVAHTRLQFAVLAYDGDGRVLNDVNNGVNVDLTPNLYEEVMSRGFPEHEEIDLPSGRVFLRVVVHDLSSDSIGATEVPLVVAKK